MPLHRGSQVYSAPPPRTTLCALGSNGNRQLGLPHADDISTPQKCIFRLHATTDSGGSQDSFDYIPLAQNEQIVKTASGGNHTLLLTSHGVVWVAGDNSVGQCGFTGLGGQVAPARPGGGWRKLHWTGLGSENKMAVSDIAANWETSYFVVAERDVYSCGANGKGELGSGRGIEYTRDVRKCFDIHDYNEPGVVKCIRACMNHVVVLSTTGRVYGWGACRKGQLGGALQDEHGSVVWTPQRIDVGLEWPVRQVVTGRDFTFALGRDLEEVVFLGDVEKCGFQDVNFDFRAGGQDEGVEGINGCTGFLIHAGWTHVVAQLGNGTLRGFGKNLKGQLLWPLPDNGIERTAMGSEHSLAVLKDGSLIAWGWGEHGNCGADVDEKGNVKGRYNTIFVPSEGQKVAGIGAGCATSFFWVEEP